MQFGHFAHEARLHDPPQITYCMYSRAENVCVCVCLNVMHVCWMSALNMHHPANDLISQPVCRQTDGERSIPRVRPNRSEYQRHILNNFDLSCCNLFRRAQTDVCYFPHACANADCQPPPLFFFMLLLLLKHRGRIFSLRENTNKHKPVESSEFIH